MLSFLLALHIYGQCVCIRKMKYINLKQNGYNVLIISTESKKISLKMGSFNQSTGILPLGPTNYIVNSMTLFCIHRFMLFEVQI